MAAIDFRPTAAKAGFSFAGLVGALAAWNDRRMTQKALNKLSDHQLDDLGLVRGDIDEISHGGLIQMRRGRRRKLVSKDLKESTDR